MNSENGKASEPNRFILKVRLSSSKKLVLFASMKAL